MIYVQNKVKNDDSRFFFANNFPCLENKRVSFCHSLAYFYTYNTMLINFSHCNNFTNQNLDSTQEAEIKCVIFVVIISPKTFFLRCS